MANGSISINPSPASTGTIPTCAATGSMNICSTGSRSTTLQNTTPRHNSTSLTGSRRDGLPTISAAATTRKSRPELVTHELFEKTPINSLFDADSNQKSPEADANQLNLFD